LVPSKKRRQNQNPKNFAKNYYGNSINSDSENFIVTLKTLKIVISSDFFTKKNWVS